MLWRIQPSQPAPNTQPDVPALASGLALHVRYNSYSNILVQIGDRQQAYLTSQGCQGCRIDRCLPSCQMQLLRRILLANRVATDLQSLPLGLAARPYRRLALAIPGPKAQFPYGELLKSWPEARLVTTWHSYFGQCMLGLALLVGAEGPAPTTILKANGWLAWSPPAPLTQAYLRQTSPAACALGWRWQQPIRLLLPASAIGPQPIETAPYQSQTTEAVADPQLISASLATFTTIETLLQQPIEANLSHTNLPEQRTYTPQLNPAQTSSYLPKMRQRHPTHTATRILSTITTTKEQPASNSSWPVGPLNYSANFIEELLTAMVAEPRLTTGRPEQIGLAVQRLKTIYAIPQTDARLLLCWFDQAGILEAPKNPSQAWANPRPFATLDLATIAERLRAIPPPEE